VSFIVHCFRCDEPVEVVTVPDEPLRCPQCDDTVLGPPSASGDRTVRWSPTSGLLLAGQREEAPVRWRPGATRGGSVVGAAMLGMQYAMFGKPDDEPGYVIVDDEPDDDDDVEVHLDEDEPRRSWIRFR
jgi:hypothetical protein